MEDERYIFNGCKSNVVFSHHEPCLGGAARRWPMRSTAGGGAGGTARPMTSVGGAGYESVGRPSAGAAALAAAGCGLVVPPPEGVLHM